MASAQTCGRTTERVTFALSVGVPLNPLQYCTCYSLKDTTQPHETAKVGICIQQRLLMRLKRASWETKRLYFLQQQNERRASLPISKTMRSSKPAFIFKGLRCSSNDNIYTAFVSLSSACTHIHGRYVDTAGIFVIGVCLSWAQRVR